MEFLSLLLQAIAAKQDWAHSDKKVLGIPVHVVAEIGTGVVARATIHSQPASDGGVVISGSQHSTVEEAFDALFKEASPQ